MERLKRCLYGSVMKATKEYLRIVFVDGSVPPSDSTDIPFLIEQEFPFKRMIYPGRCGSEPVRVLLGVLAPSQPRKRRVSNPNETGRNESQPFLKDERFDAPKRTGCTTPSRLPRPNLEARSKRFTMHECLWKNKQMDAEKIGRELGEGRCRSGSSVTRKRP